MIQDFTLHTHTIGFDGDHTVAEMAMRASELGFKTIGISNHFILHPDILSAPCYGYSRRGHYQNIYCDNFDEIMSRFSKHRDDLERVAADANINIRILRGFEADFFYYPKWQTLFQQAIKILQPDYIIGACHFVEHNGTLCNVHDMANADSVNRDIMLNKYWQKIRDASNSGLFSWMAHLDLPQKKLVGTDEKWIETEAKVIETLKQNKTTIEINTGLYRPYCNEPYPSPRIMKMVANANLPVLFSDDAHNVNQIMRHFDEAKQLAQECGIKNYLTLQKILDFSQKNM